MHTHSTQKHTQQRKEKNGVEWRKKFKYRLHRKFMEVKTCTIFRPLKHFRNCIQYSYHPDKEEKKPRRRKRRRSLWVLCVCWVLSLVVHNTHERKLDWKYNVNFENVSMLWEEIGVRGHISNILFATFLYYRGAGPECVVKVSLFMD